MNKHSAFWRLISAVFIILFIGEAIKDGMFMDGVIYASVSKNLAYGVGSFWSLHYSNTFLNHYCEQLPLFFGIQSLFFRVLGDGMYTERLFGVFMALLTGFNIHLIWRLLLSEHKDKRELSWLPILLWMVMPICFWSFTNNVQETLMTVFATASIYFILKAILISRYVLLNLILGGFFIFCCSFCKGFQGLFPIASVGLFWMGWQGMSFTKMIRYSAVLLVIPFLIYIAIWLTDSGLFALESYFNNRILRTFTQAASATTHFRAYLIVRLVQELIPSLCIGLMVIIGCHRIGAKWSGALQTQNIMFFVGVGISGSFPLMVTLEQRAFYLTPSLPFYALALAFFLLPYVQLISLHVLQGAKRQKYFQYFSLFLLIGSLVYSTSQIGKTRRDVALLKDVYAIGEKVPVFSTLCAFKEAENQFALRAYLVRHFNISTDPFRSDSCTYYLESNKYPSVVSGKYQIVNVDLINHRLWTQNIAASPHP